MYMNGFLIKFPDGSYVGFDNKKEIKTTKENAYIYYVYSSVESILKYLKSKNASKELYKDCIIVDSKNG